MHAVPVRSMTWWGLASFTYVCVCGGPFGLEAAVNSGGALITVLAIPVLAIIWELPQALMTAEMATTFPDNGGVVVVRAARS